MYNHNNNWEMNPGPSSSNPMQQHHPSIYYQNPSQDAFTSYLAHESNENATYTHNTPRANFSQSQQPYQAYNNVDPQYARAAYSCPFYTQDTINQSLHTRVPPTPNQELYGHFGQVSYMSPMATRANLDTIPQSALLSGAYPNPQRSNQTTGYITNNSNNNLLSENHEAQMGFTADVSTMQSPTILTHDAQYLQSQNDLFSYQQSSTGNQTAPHGSAQYSTIMHSRASPTSSHTSDEDGEMCMDRSVGYPLRRNTSINTRRKRIRDVETSNPTVNQNKRQKFE